MRFFTESVTKCTARLGILNGFDRMPDARFETPLLLMYTKGGSVPHLTADVFKNVTSEQQMLSVSLPSTITMANVLKELDIPFSQFVNMQEHINFLSIQDPAYATTSGFQKLNSIAVWGRTGRHSLSPNTYMKIVETFKPDLYIALCDGDTNKNSSAKRVSKAVSRSKTLLEECLEIHFKSDTLKSRAILGAVEGGYDLEERAESIDHLKDQPLAGFVIDGLHNNGPNVQNIRLEQVKEIVKHTINLLPADKIRVLMGCWSPITVLDLVDLGIDIFDSSYAFTMTEESKALTFMCDHDSCQHNSPVLSINIKSNESVFLPICNKCTCLTCQNHTRAYLHHLHSCKEMLASVLLMIHNVHHYIEFFTAIRNSLKTDTLDQLRKKISVQYES